MNRIKFQSLEKGQLWFSYYKFLNDKTEFDMKYNVKKVSYRTGIPSDNIMFFIATMKEIYDVCSLTYSCENYMWKAYSNNSRRICLVFNVIDYDMLYPVEYVDKNKVDYTEMLIEAYNSSPKEFFYSFVILLYDRPIGQSERRTGDSFVVSSLGWIRIEILNDRCYDTEAELGYFGSSFDIFFLIVHGMITSFKLMVKHTDRR